MLRAPARPPTLRDWIHYASDAGFDGETLRREELIDGETVLSREHAETYRKKDPLRTTFIVSGLLTAARISQNWK
ncbi:MAG: hypothetical protein K2I27_06425, partial [Bacteroides sp.]|nr:hypothetical protein [Bacteroides sp.]